MVIKKTKLKKTEIGLIPEDWEVTLAEDFCVRVTDGTHASPKKRSKGKYLITSRHLKQNKLDFDNAYLISEEDFKEVNKRSKVDQFDILFSMIGTVGETYQEKSDEINYAIKNIGLFKFGGDKNKSTWFLYWIKSPIAKNYIQTRQAGSTQQYLTLNALRKFPVAFPQNIQEQRAIAKILSDLDSKIELLQKQNKTLEAIGQAIFKHWFVDFEFPNKEGKPYKSSGGEMVYNEELGKEIPEGWRVGKIEDLCSSITNGGTPKRMEKSFWEGKIPWFKTGELTDNPLIDSEEHISKEGLKNSSCKLWDINTILIALYASPTVGRLGILKTKGTSNQACSGLVAKKEIGYPFLFYVLLNKRTEFNNIAVGAAQQNISAQIVKKAKVIIPPLDILRNFNKLGEVIFDKRTLISYQIQTLSQIRDSLLPRLMSGKIRVPVGTNR